MNYNITWNFPKRALYYVQLNISKLSPVRDLYCWGPIGIHTWVGIVNLSTKLSAYSYIIYCLTPPGLRTFVIIIYYPGSQSAWNYLLQSRYPCKSECFRTFKYGFRGKMYNKAPRVNDSKYAIKSFYFYLLKQLYVQLFQDGKSSFIILLL